MKLRPMTLVRWVELIWGAFIPSILLGFLSLIPISTLTDSFPWFFDGQNIRWSGPWFFRGQIAVADGGIIALWLLILFGPDQINQRPLLRWFAILTGVPFLVMCIGEITLLIGAFFGIRVFDLLYPLVQLAPGLLLAQLMGGSFTTGMMTVILVPVVWLGPVVVGLRYLPALLRGSR